MAAKECQKRKISLSKTHRNRLFTFQIATQTVSSTSKTDNQALTKLFSRVLERVIWLQAKWNIRFKRQVKAPHLSFLSWLLSIPMAPILRPSQTNLRNAPRQQTTDAADHLQTPDKKNQRQVDLATKRLSPTDEHVPHGRLSTERAVKQAVCQELRQC